MLRATQIAAVAGTALLTLASTQAAATAWKLAVIASSAVGNPQHILSLNLVGNIPAINELGDVTFTGSAMQGSQGVSEVWLSRHENPPSPIASTSSSDFPYLPSINRAGSVSFSDVTQSGAQTTQIVAVTKSGTIRYPTIYNGAVWASIVNDDRVIVQSGGQLSLLSGDSVTVVNPGFCDVSFSVASNASGQVAYSNCIYENSIYVTNSRHLVTKLRVGGESKVGTASQPAINGKSVVAFTGTTVPGQTGNISALYTATPSGRVSLISEVNNGTCSSSGPPGGKGSCSYVSYYTPSINAAGSIALIIDVANFVGTSASSASMLVMNGDQRSPIISSGDLIDGCTVSGISTGTQALNNAGQLAALLYCADFSARVIVATPTQ